MIIAHLLVPFFSDGSDAKAALRRKKAFTRKQKKEEKLAKMRSDKVAKRKKQMKKLQDWVIKWDAEQGDFSEEWNAEDDEPKQKKAKPAKVTHMGLRLGLTTAGGKILSLNCESANRIVLLMKIDLLCSIVLIAFSSFQAP